MIPNHAPKRTAQNIEQGLDPCSMERIERHAGMTFEKSKSFARVGTGVHMQLIIPSWEQPHQWYQPSSKGSLPSLISKAGVNPADLLLGDLQKKELQHYLGIEAI